MAILVFNDRQEYGWETVNTGSPDVSMRVRTVDPISSPCNPRPLYQQGQAKLPCLWIRLIHQ